MSTPEVREIHSRNRMLRDQRNGLYLFLTQPHLKKILPVPQEIQLIIDQIESEPIIS